MSEEQAAPAVQEGDLVIGNFQMSMQIPNGGSVMMTGMVYLKDGADDLNQRMDRFRDAISRQQAIAEIPTLEASLIGVDKQIQQTQEMIDAVNTKKKGGKKLTSQEQNHDLNLPNSLKMLIGHRAEGQKRIDDLKAKYGV